MKELKISQLMDDYVDNEVCIEGETLVDNEELKGLVLGQAETKRKVKPLFKGLIVAAVAACLVGVAGASTIAVISSKYTSVLGSEIEYNLQAYPDRWQIWTVGLDRILPVTMEAERLFFNADGEKSDITDIINENTPYIHKSVNAEGYPCWQITGGTLDDYGYLEIYQNSEGWKADGLFAKNDEGYKPWAAAAIEMVGVDGELDYCDLRPNVYVNRPVYDFNYIWKANPDMYKTPVTLTDDGRIIFCADGQELDVTDIIDENTPYIYPFKDPDGYDSYILVGGTPEDYGWVHLYTLGGWEWRWMADGGNAIWGVDRPWNERYKAWYVEALNELDIPAFPQGTYGDSPEGYYAEYNISAHWDR